MLVALSGCFASMTSVARNSFAKEYGCDEVHVGEIGDDGVVEVSGCEKHARYTCVPGYDTRHHGAVDTSCSVRPRFEIEATDGTWQDDWKHDDVAADAASKSAAHDIPCALESLTSLDALTVDGCGQRVTYREIPTSA